MAFGQASGPPASARDVARLAELLAEAGFDSFREARHPYDLNQRQAGGRFTRDEAAALLERLEREAGEREEGEGAGSPPPARRPARREVAPGARRPRSAPAEGATDVVTAFPDELLAEELVRRGWTCTPPG